MNIKMMEQFEIMDTDMLACVEGGFEVGEICFLLYWVGSTVSNFGSIKW